MTQSKGEPNYVQLRAATGGMVREWQARTSAEFRAALDAVNGNKVTLHVAPGVTWQLSPAINVAALEEALEAINVALSYNDGWDVYRNWQPPGRCIRSNEAMAGWKAARTDAREMDVERD